MTIAFAILVLLLTPLVMSLVSRALDWLWDRRGLDVHAWPRERIDMTKENIVTGLLFAVVALVAILLIAGCSAPRMHLLDRAVAAGCEVKHVSEIENEGISNVEVDCK